MTFVRFRKNDDNLHLFLNNKYDKRVKKTSDRFEAKDQAIIRYAVLIRRGELTAKLDQKVIEIS